MHGAGWVAFQQFEPGEVRHQRPLIDVSGAATACLTHKLVHDPRIVRGDQDGRHLIEIGRLHHTGTMLDREAIDEPERCLVIACADEHDIVAAPETLKRALRAADDVDPVEPGPSLPLVAIDKDGLRSVLAIRLLVRNVQSLRSRRQPHGSARTCSPATAGSARCSRIREAAEPSS